MLYHRLVDWLYSSQHKMGNFRALRNNRRTEQCPSYLSLHPWKLQMKPCEQEKLILAFKPNQDPSLNGAVTSWYEEYDYGIPRWILDKGTWKYNRLVSAMISVHTVPKPSWSPGKYTVILHFHKPEIQTILKKVFFFLFFLNLKLFFWTLMGPNESPFVN